MESLIVAKHRAEARALLILDHTQGVGLRSITDLTEAFGSARASLSAPRREVAAVVGARRANIGNDPEVERLVDTGLAQADRLGIQVWTWWDAPYPEAFRHLADPPPVLFLRGRVELLETPGVTIVGARRATARARDVSRRLASALARGGRTVVSGLALGIDGAAHTGALEVDGDTVAVLGRGADRAYPGTHTRLFQDIVERGLVVSEFLPGTPALPHHFPRRNRLLAALADAVVVVEAARKSGSLITVEHALDLGIDVYAVPGPIDQEACEGSNALLEDGARPLVSIRRFVAERGGEAAEGAGSGPSPEGPEAQLLQALGAGSQRAEHIAELVGLDVPEVLAMLAALEVRGWVEQEPGLRFRRAG